MLAQPNLSNRLRNKQEALQLQHIRETSITMRCVVTVGALLRADPSSCVEMPGCRYMQFLK